MTRFTVEARSDVLTVSLNCEAGDGRLIILEEGSGLPDVTVQAFRPAMDIFYRSPESLTPEELAEEISIHVPQSLLQIPQGRLVPSAMGRLVLMQYVHPAFPAISPLVALHEILRATADVNFGILQADNGGLLFLHRSGNEISAYASAHSLRELLELSKGGRESLFPDIHADEVLIGGSDLDHFENLNLGPIEIARKISIADFLPLCEIMPEVAAIIEHNPHVYTLAIGAARAYAAIGGWIA
ncbi:MAG: hypothetical protein ACHQNE_10465 [Candidatus Kapaibacterium sp.]